MCRWVAHWLGPASISRSRQVPPPSREISAVSTSLYLPLCGRTTSYPVPLRLLASFWLPSPFCPLLSSLQHKPDCLPALHKTRLWLPVPLSLARSSRVQAPSSFPSLSPAVAFALMTQDGSYDASLRMHIPGSGMAVARPHLVIRLAGPPPTRPRCHSACIFSSPLPFSRTLWPHGCHFAPHLALLPPHSRPVYPPSLSSPTAPAPPGVPQTLGLT